MQTPRTNDDPQLQKNPTAGAARFAAATFDVTARTSREQIRREIIKLFRYTDLSPRQVLERLMQQFHGGTIGDEERRTFLRHVTVWVREEVLIRGAGDPVKPNPHADLLKAFRYLDRVDPPGAAILELAYAAELAAEEIANVLGLAPEDVGKKLQYIQSWLRRVAAGEPHESYQIEAFDRVEVTRIQK